MAFKKRKRFKKKLEGFQHENNAAKSVVNRLSKFIKDAEGDRHLKSIQKYIDETVSIINIHLERVSKYYNNNIPEEVWSQQEKIIKESDFQNKMFEGEIKLIEDMDKLNITNNMENLEVSFHSERIASIPMKDSLCLFSYDIKDKIDALDIDWDLVISNEFFINIPEKKRPKYNPRKHFFDQDKDILQFYVSEWNKIKYGFIEGGYYVHPWLYWHLNFFKTPIPTEKGEEVVNPPLRDNEWYFAEILKKADARKDAGILIYGSRRISKSTLISSYLQWKALISTNANVSVTGGNDKDLADLTDKIETSLKAIHPAFKVLTNKEDWSKEVEFGLKTKNGEKIKLSDARIINLDGGSKNSSQKTAGGAPVAFVIEEIGKFSWRAAFDTAIPSFETLDGWKTIPILIGTAGESDLSVDAEKALNNPELNDLMEMDWDLLEKNIPKEFITWKRRPFGYFVPAQMAYKKGFKRNKIKFSDFLKIDSEILDKIILHETDWEHNTKVCLDRRDKLKNDKEKYQKEVVFYPLDPEDCFMSAENNPFPATTAKKRRDHLIAEGDSEKGIAKAVELYRKDNGDIGYYLAASKEVAKYPHQGGFIDSPILLFEEIPDKQPLKYTYTAGLDDYKHEQSNGDSVGVITIYKRAIGTDEKCNKIAAMLATRPDPHGYFHKQIHLLLDAFNAICFPENEDMDIKKYFDKLGLSWKYLGEGFDVTKQFNVNNTGNRKYGWQPGNVLTPMVINFVVDYCKQEFEIKDDKGNIIDIKLGVELIDDIHLLEEIIKYKKGGNFDRIISFGSSLFYDHYLNVRNIYPRKRQKKMTETNNHAEKSRNRNRFFSKTRRKLL